MKPKLRKFLRYAPLCIGLALLAIAAAFVPWHKVWPYFRELSILNLLALAGLSLCYYLGRILRYWLMLRMLGQPTKFGTVSLAYLVAQPVSMMPGGELFRGVTLKRYAGVSLSDSAPGVFAQSLAESIGLVGIAIMGAAAIHHYLLVTVALGLVFALILAGINYYQGHHAHRLTNLVPGINFHPSKVRAYLNRNRVLLSGGNFFVLLGTSFISTGAGILILLIAVGALDQHLSLAQTAIAFTLPVTLEALSFLPGGLGTNEGSSVGLLVLFHIATAPAIAITIVVRLFTLGIGFLYGFLAIGYAHLKYPGNRKPK